MTASPVQVSTLVTEAAHTILGKQGYDTTAAHTALMCCAGGAVLTGPRRTKVKGSSLDGAGGWSRWRPQLSLPSTDGRIVNVKREGYMTHQCINMDVWA